VEFSVGSSGSSSVVSGDGELGWFEVAQNLGAWLYFLFFSWAFVLVGWYTSSCFLEICSVCVSVCGSYLSNASACYKKKSVGVCLNLNSYRHHQPFNDQEVVNGNMAICCILYSLNLDHKCVILNSAYS
jgi:hypothetical protein